MNLNLTTSEKETIWNLLTEYDNNDKFVKLTDALANVLKNTATNNDILTIGMFINANKINIVDSKRLNEVIGNEVDNLFFILT